MTVAIYGRPFNKNITTSIQRLIDKLNQCGVDWIMYAPLQHYLQGKVLFGKETQPFATAAEMQAKQVDFLFSVGGDGTLLDTITYVHNSGIPILGINSGRLGFLANITFEDISAAIDAVLEGHYTLDKRDLLRLESNLELFGINNFALNELTLHKKDTSSMITIHTYLNGEYLNSYWADGLIISTPTGSTGYSLSCGGPILVPQSESFVITPIAPHNLNVRPIIVSDKNVISIEVEGRSEHFMASLDSRSVTIDASVQLAVRKEDFKVSLVRLNNTNFMDTLRDKLMWGLDTRN